MSTTSITQKFKVSTICGLANMIALYDFTLFAVLLPIIHNHFFMDNGDSSSILIGYLSFAVSFLIAPFASIFWGYIGDKYGKANLMKYSLLIMAIPSLIIALTPSYAAIGVLATFILIKARVLQGISASAEVLGSKIYAFEEVGEDFQTMASGLISCFGALGVMASMYMGVIISNSENHDIWRIAFLIGATLFILMFAFRYKKLKTSDTKSDSITISSIFTVLAQSKDASIYAFTLSAALGCLSYFLHSFMIAFMIQHTQNASLAYSIASTNLFITALVAAFTGVLSLFIRINNKLIIKILLLVCAVTFFPAFYFIKATLLSASLMMSFYAIILGIFAAISSVEVVNSFSEDARCRGALFVNALGVALFGGITPVALIYLNNIDTTYPGIALAIFFVIATLFIARR